MLKFTPAASSTLCPPLLLLTLGLSACAGSSSGHSQGPDNGAAEPQPTASCDGSGTDLCDQWLNAHNQVRRQLNAGTLTNSPKPDDGIADLQWDSRLAQVAQSYADQCQYAHNGQRGDQYQALGGDASVGENIAAYYSSQPPAQQVYSPAQFTALWQSEMEDFVYEPLGTTVSYQDVGHYTQLIWRSTTHVGCAIAQCQTGGSTPYMTYAVCDYSPSSNYLNQYPY